MASTKVRGITIELGADASGLQKALGKINSEIGQTQKELKDVERLLKLDPKNTELLEQKQRLLGERIGETKTKLDALKKAQEEVGSELEKTGKGQEQYDALTREIASCTIELGKLEERASKSHQALEKISAAGEKLKDVGGKIEGVGNSLKYVSAAAAGALTGIVKTTADFDSGMSKVAAVSGAAGSDFDALREKAREMGATTKFTATEASEAMNYMAMAGWKTEQMLGGISGIMNLAAASGEELATTSDIVTDALTAFGMKAEDSGRFADILASAASNANTNVAMMGESFKYAAPVAGSLGYSAEDVAVALGLMANSGIKASLAGTSLRNMFTRMAKPTKESEAAMERLGISLQDDEGNMYSFRQIMDQLRKSFVKINMPLDEYNKRLDLLDEQLEASDITQKQYDKELEELNKQAFNAEGAEKARAAAMLGGTRAMAGLLAITNATEEDYEKLTTAIDNSSQAFAKTKDGIIPLNEALASGAEIIETYEGTAASMAATMQDNAAGQMEILKSQIQEFAISLGDTLMPTIRDVLDHLQAFVDKLNGMDEGTKNAIVNFLLVTAALAPLLITVGKITSGFGSLLSAIGGVSAPILGIVAAVAALGVAFYTLWVTNETFRDKVIGYWDEVQTRFDEFGDHLTQRLNELGFEFEDFGDVIKGSWEVLCESLIPIFEISFGAVADILTDTLDIIEGTFDFWIGIFTGNWQQAWEGVKTTFDGIWGMMVDSVKIFCSLMIAPINAIIKGINKVATAAGKSTIPEIPSFMAEGGVLTSGSAIVGEAGPEFVHISDGKAMVTPLSGDNDIGALLETYLPYLAAGTQMVMDSGALVGSIAPDMNTALGTIAIRGGRR